MSADLCLPATSLEKVVLPNLATLIAEPAPGSAYVAMHCVLRGGSMAEWPCGGSGVAHLMEHLVGTLAAERMERGAQSAVIRGATRREELSFSWTALPEEAAPSLRSFLEALQDTDGWSLAFEAQRRVVLEEIHLFGREPVGPFQQRFLEEMFKVHPVRYPVSGSLGLVAAVGLEEVAAYHERICTGPQLVMSVVGDIDPQEIIEVFSAAGGQLPVRPPFTLTPAAREPAPGGDRRFDFKADRLQAPSLMIGFRAPGCEAEDAACLEALARAVNRPDHELRRELVGSGLAHDLACGSVALPYEAGYCYFWIRHPLSNEAKIEERLRAWLRRASSGTFDPAHFKGREGQGIRGERAFLVRRAAELGRSEVRFGDPFGEERFENQVRQVKGEEVSRALASYGCGTGLTIGRLSDEARVGRRLLGHTVPAPWATRLPNGVRILVLPTPHPQVGCQIMGRGGTLAETGKTSGLCSLMARQLAAAENGRWAALADSKARFQPFCDESFFGISLVVSPESALEGVERLASLMLRPVFQPSQLEGALRQNLAALENLPWELALRQRLKQVLFQRHPYRRSENGTASSLKRLTVEQVQSCHQRLCRGDNLVAVVTGRVVPEQIGERLALHLAAAVAGPPEMPETGIEPVGNAPQRAACHNLWGLGALALGFSGIRWTPGNFEALEVLRALLLGPEDDWVRGRLIRSLREAGLSYRCWGMNQAGFGNGYFALFAAFPAGREEEALVRVERELRRLREGEITTHEVRYANRLLRLYRLQLTEWPRRQSYFAGRRLLFSGETTLSEPEEAGIDDLVAVAGHLLREEAKGIVISKLRYAEWEERCGGLPQDRVH